MANILVVAAHSDDEALGCSGALFKHKENCDSIHYSFMTNGVSSRECVDQKMQSIRIKSTKKAMQILPIDSVRYGDYPDNALDSVPLLDIVKSIEHTIEDINPDIIYTHFKGDLNIDHRITYQAVMTAARPLPGAIVRKILSFEVVSSTEWASGDSHFVPNYFIDISQFLDKKMEYLRCYDQEMRRFPHARSYENVESLAKYRGASVGVMAAEAFMVNRIIK